MNERISPDHILTLNDGEIFVFGSNEAGIHGAGAAKFAYNFFGAQWGKGVGLYGRSYAIPTKDNRIITLPTIFIQIYVDGFIEYANLHKDLKFMVTEIGCGLAHYKPSDIAPLFNKAIDVENIYLPKRFIITITNGKAQ
jgi:hypothetical protein